MPIVTPDGVRHVTQDPGTGDLTFGDVVAGFRSVQNAVDDGDLTAGETVYYVVLEDGGAFEAGSAAVASDGGGPATYTLERTAATVIASTNGGAKINAAGGGLTQIFFATPEAVALRAQDRRSQGGTLAETDQAQTFVGNQSVVGSLTVRSDDAGAAEGPLLDLHRNSASPATSDLLGALRYLAEDDADNADVMAVIKGLLRDPASGSEDAGLIIEAMRAGALRELLRLTGDNGIGFFGAALQGDNTANFPTGGLMVNGVAIAPGAMQHLRTETVSGTPSTLDFTADITDAYDTFLLIIDSLTLSADTELRLRCGDGAFDAGASDYGWSYGSQSGSITDADNSASEIQLTNDVGAGAVHSGQILITRARTAGSETFLTSAIGTHTTSSQLWDGASRRDTAAVIDRIRLFVALGTFTAGDVQLFGVAT